LSKNEAIKFAELQQRRGRSRRAFFEYQYEAARGSLDEMRRFTDTQNKEMLDLGCGYGGASVYFAMNGLRVTGADNQLYEDKFLKDAIYFAKEKEAVVTFCLADAHKLPFRRASFDIIRLDSVLEHLENPEVAVSECRRVLKPEGLLFVNFPLFYSPYGGHTIDYIKIPWFHILPDRLVRQAIRRQQSKFRIITTDYVEKLYMSLNKMTLKRYYTLIKQNNLKEIYSEETFYMPHDAALFVNELKSSISTRSLKNVREKFVHLNRISLIIFIFLFFLYRFPLRFVKPFNEVIVSGIRSVLRT